MKHTKSGRTVSYGDICLQAAKLQVPQDPPLKNESEFRYIGKTMPRVDVPEKVSGKAVYGADVKVKDLHYAVIARPPAYGAKPVSFDEKAAMQVKGVKKVFSLPMGIAVCADSFVAAEKGRDALKVQWDKGEIPEMDNAYVEKSMMDDLNKPLVSVVKTGDAKKAISEGTKKLEANYYCPPVYHATMEPMNSYGFGDSRFRRNMDAHSTAAGPGGCRLQISGTSQGESHLDTSPFGMRPGPASLA